MYHYNLSFEEQFFGDDMTSRDVIVPLNVSLYAMEKFRGWGFGLLERLFLNCYNFLQSKAFLDLSTDPFL